jgi:hypothetical protein
MQDDPTGKVVTNFIFEDKKIEITLGPALELVQKLQYEIETLKLEVERLNRIIGYRNNRKIRD